MMTAYQPDAVTRSEVDQRFKYHGLKEGQAQRLTELREAFGLLAQMILDQAPPGREQSLSLTRLEEANAWAEFSITRHE